IAIPARRLPEARRTHCLSLLGVRVVFSLAAGMNDKTPSTWFSEKGLEDLPSERREHHSSNVLADCSFEAAARAASPALPAEPFADAPTSTLSDGRRKGCGGAAGVGRGSFMAFSR